jgi:hypothetical protein
MFKDLNPILHSQLRLALVSILISVKEAGYIDVAKQFKDNYPQTICKITPQGVLAFEQYVKDLQSYLDIKK